MEAKQFCNFVLPYEQYEKLKKLALELKVSQSFLMRKGVELILSKHSEESSTIGKSELVEK